MGDHLKKGIGIQTINTDKHQSTGVHQECPEEFENPGQS